jgi:hypothetical protein
VEARAMMTPLEELKSEVADLFQRREFASRHGMLLESYSIWTSQIARKLEEYVGLLEAENQSLKAELAKRPAVYIAKLPFGTMFMTHEEPQVFLSIENAKKWFATVPIYDVEFELYTGQQREDEEEPTNDTA